MKTCEGSHPPSPGRLSQAMDAGLSSANSRRAPPPEGARRKWNGRLTATSYLLGGP